MRSKEEIEKYRDEVNKQIKKEYEWLKRCDEIGKIRGRDEVTGWIMDDTTKLITLDWVLEKGIDKEESVTITKEEYDHLSNEKAFLKCLRTAGVETWEGYHTAQEMYEEEV